jgi:hypothetical protein
MRPASIVIAAFIVITAALSGGRLASIIMPLGFMLSFSWVAVHRPLSAACQHRPA